MEDAEIKDLCVELVRRVEPDSTFVVEENFDALRKHWKTGEPRAEGQFTVPDLVVTFASVVVPFIAGFMLDVAKEAAKTLIVDKLKKVLKDDEKRDEDRTIVLQTILVHVDASDFRTEEKRVLREGFVRILS